MGSPSVPQHSLSEPQRQPGTEAEPGVVLGGGEVAICSSPISAGGLGGSCHC